MANKERRSSLFSKLLVLLSSELSQSDHGGLGSLSDQSGWGPGTSGDLETGSLVLPDTDAGSLQGGLSVRGGVFLMLRDFEFLDDLSQRHTISNSEFSANSDFFSSFGHFCAMY